MEAPLACGAQRARGLAHEGVGEVEHPIEVVAHGHDVDVALEQRDARLQVADGGAAGDLADRTERSPVLFEFASLGVVEPAGGGVGGVGGVVEVEVEAHAEAPARDQTNWS